MTRLWGIFTAACIALALPPAALAQENSPSVLDRIFGTRAAPESTQQMAQQADAAELIVRIDRLEAQIRQLTGTIEQLQYRNQQLETQIKTMESPTGPKPPAPAAGVRPQPSVAAPAMPAPAPPAPPPGRRSDIFDPNQHPSAPGAPRTLGTLPSGPVPGPHAELPREDVAVPPIGVPDGRTPGAPLDLDARDRIPRASAARCRHVAGPGCAATGAAAAGPELTGTTVARVRNLRRAITASPTATCCARLRVRRRGVQKRSSTSIRTTRGCPTQFWLGESMFQRQRYDTAPNNSWPLPPASGYAKAPDASPAPSRSRWRRSTRRKWPVLRSPRWAANIRASNREAGR